jgi:hypothetical protein
METKEPTTVLTVEVETKETPEIHHKRELLYKIKLDAIKFVQERDPGAALMCLISGLEHFGIMTPGSHPDVHLMLQTMAIETESNGNKNDAVTADFFLANFDV